MELPNGGLKIVFTRGVALSSKMIRCGPGAGAALRDRYDNAEPLSDCDGGGEALSDSDIFQFF